MVFGILVFYFAHRRWVHKIVVFCFFSFDLEDFMAFFKGEDEGGSSKEQGPTNFSAESSERESWVVFHSFS